MKKREKRRYLTEKYVRRQVRLYFAGSFRKGLFDDKRHMQSERAKRNYFVAELTGQVVRLSSSDNPITAMWWWGITELVLEIEKEQLGHFRRHSATDCGNSQCPTCCNPRRIFRGKRKATLTIKERLGEMSFAEQIEEYFTEKEGK